MTADILLVVAGALIDDAGRVLVAQRPDGKDHAGLWEFPGGKIEAGEAPIAALTRELSEELAVTIDPAAVTPISFAVRAAGERSLCLLLFAVDRWHGVPVAREHRALAWHLPQTLTAVAMPPADGALLTALICYLERP